MFEGSYLELEARAKISPFLLFIIQMTSSFASRNSRFSSKICSSLVWNLSGIEINFNSDSNYIIGENNLGKSNLLDILEIVLNGKKFDEDDYFNEQFNIEMVLKLKLEDYEKGYI